MAREECSKSSLIHRTLILNIRARMTSCTGFEIIIAFRKDDTIVNRRSDIVAHWWKINSSIREYEMRAASSVYLIFAETCVTKNGAPSPSSWYKMTFSTEIKRTLFHHTSSRTQSIFQRSARLSGLNLSFERCALITEVLSAAEGLASFMRDTHAMTVTFINCVTFQFRHLWKEMQSTRHN